VLNQGDPVVWWFWGEDTGECLLSCVEGTEMTDRLQMNTGMKKPSISQLLVLVWQR